MRRCVTPESRFPFHSGSYISNKTTRPSTAWPNVMQTLAVICAREAVKPTRREEFQTECAKGKTERMPSLFQKKWPVPIRCGFALLLCQWCGCAAHLATVKTIPARLTTGLHVEGPLEAATKYLLEAEHEQPSAALGHDLLAANISYGVLQRQPNDE